MPNELTSFAPQSFEQAREFANFIAKTQFVPESYRNKPDEILACIMYGNEVGLSAMQSLQSIAMINGRPSIFGDAMLAMAYGSGKLEYIKEWEEGDTAFCEVKRKGDPEPRISRWSADDTKTAGLGGKGPHQQYPRRMRQFRARGFGLRDKFPDVYKGIISHEEAIDITPPDEIAGGGGNPDLGSLSAEETPQARVDVVMDSAVSTQVVPDESVIADDGEIDIQPLANGTEPPADRQLNEKEQERVRAAWKNAKGGSAAKMKALGEVVPGFTGISTIKYSELAAILKALA